MPEPRRRAAKSELVDIHIPLTITKVDAERRLVTGVATAEIIDKAGEVMVYDHAKECFKDWPGNIREMHNPHKAVGRAVDVQFDDVLKEIAVTSKISRGAEDTWQKVLDGTLTGYSVGGKGFRTIQKMDGRQVTVVKMSQLYELSLVDNPAVPNSRIEIVKRAGGVDIIEPLTDDDRAAVAKREIPAAERDDMPASDFAGKHESYPIKKPQDVWAAARAIGESQKPGVDNYSAATLKANITRIAMRKGPAYVARLPQAWKSTQVATAKAVGATEARVEKTVGKRVLKDMTDYEACMKELGAMPDGPDAKQLRKEFAEAASSSGIEECMKMVPEGWGAEDQTKAVGGEIATTWATAPGEIRKQLETYDVRSALMVLDGLQQLIGSEYSEAQMPDAAEEEKAHVQILREAFVLVRQFVDAEFDEQFTDLEKAADAQRITRDEYIAAVNDPARTLQGVAVLKAFDASRFQGFLQSIKRPVIWARLDGSGQVSYAQGLGGAIEKKGARHNKADLTMIQNMHDHAVALGAECAPQETEAMKSLMPAIVEEIRKMAANGELAPTPIAKAEGGETVNAPGQGSVGQPAGTTTPASMSTDGGGGAAGGGSQSAVAMPAATSAPGEAAAAAVVKTADGVAEPTEEAINKIAGDVVKALQPMFEGFTTKVTELQSTVSAQAATIETLEKSVDGILKTPVPGGPLTRAVPGTSVEKRAPGEGGAVVPPQQEAVEVAIRALTRIANNPSATDITKELAAAELVKLQHTTGFNAGVVTFERPSN